jgi:hypothetical protein
MSEHQLSADEDKALRTALRSSVKIRSSALTRPAVGDALELQIAGILRDHVTGEVNVAARKIAALSSLPDMQEVQRPDQAASA